jgi:hypothetical protein
MIKHLTIILLLFLFLASRVHAQQVVHDKYKRRQMESMVVTRWGKFIPKWYYVLFHNKYRKGEDRRNMRQLLPTVAALSITDAQSEQEKEDSDQLFEQAGWRSTNRTLESHHHLYFKAHFAQLNLEIDALLIKAQQLHVDPSVIQTFRFEQSRLNGQIDILRDGFLAKGDSIEGMQEIENEMIDLKGMLHAYLGHQKIRNKYIQP